MKYKEKGEDGLGDKRGRHKSDEVEKLRRKVNKRNMNQRWLNWR